MSRKIAFLTTIFPMDIDYLRDFFASLSNQTYKDFDIVVVNDGYVNFLTIKNNYPRLNIIELKYSSSPVQNREHGINYCLEHHYDILIFGDSDDYFSKNRIETCIKHLNVYDVVVNDLTLFGKNGIYSQDFISNRVTNNSEIDIEFIKNKNIFGMSNTAINARIFNNIDFDPGLIALDWYIFSKLLLQNNKAIFTSETTSYYRQYDENTVGIGKISKELFLKGILVKKKHYELLKNVDLTYECLYNEMNILNVKIMDENYLEKLLNQEIQFPLWWEEIKLIKESA